MQEQENQIKTETNQNVINDAFDLEITAPGKLRVIKRNGKVFNKNFVVLNIWQLSLLQNEVIGFRIAYRSFR